MIIKYINLNFWRILGGLLSAHLIAVDNKQPFGNMTINNYNDELLKLAHDLGVRILTAFENTNTEIPYPRVFISF